MSEIITPTNQELITGIFRNEPEEVYHGRREYISSSALPYLDTSPAHFNEYMKNGVEKTDPMERGSFIHKLLLEQDIAKYVPRPLNEDGSLVRSNTKEYKAWLENIGGKTPLDPTLYNDAMAVLTAALQNKKYAKSFEECEKEVSFYAIDDETGLPMKARTDMVEKNFSYILDLKSTSDVLKFGNQIFYLSYDVRLIHYSEVILRCTGILIDDLRFIAIESKAPYGSINYRLTQGQVAEARMKWRQLMNTISACKADNNWPAFSDEWNEPIKPKNYGTSEVSFSGGF